MSNTENQGKVKFNPVRFLLYIPVPWVYVLTYLTSLVPQYFWPVVIQSHKAITTIKIAGVVLFVIGAFYAGWGLLIFHRAQTTTTPGETSKKLVMSGPYRLSRNPMYVGLILAYLGEAGLLAQVWPVIFIPLIFSYVNWIVIPLEETVLKGDFGAEYENYCKRVHRWL
jgi:protein-S-isoprenylcysteine O-methyltransferase Ste14